MILFQSAVTSGLGRARFVLVAVVVVGVGVVVVMVVSLTVYGEGGERRKRWAVRGVVRDM